MKRKQKLIITVAIICAAAVAIADIVLQWYEQRKLGERLTWEKYNPGRTLGLTFLGLGAGATLGYFRYNSLVESEKAMPFNPDEYLAKVLTEENVKSDPRLLDAMLKFRKEIKERVWKEYKDHLCCYPEDGGSFFKRTANLSTYDLDIILPFKRNISSSLKEMYDDVCDTIVEGYGKRAEVYRQTKAIGITIEYDDIPLYFDIIPGREINDYNREKELNLYVRPDFFWQRGRSFKINTALQRGLTVNKPEVRRAIRLIKVYRDKNGLHLPSVIIEQCCAEALNQSKYGTYYSDTENFLNCMDHIVKRVEQNSFIDIANSNNNLNDKLTGQERSLLSQTLTKVIKKVDLDPRYLKEIL